MALTLFPYLQYKNRSTHTQENVHTQLQYKIKYNEIMVKPLLRGHLTLPKWSGHLISLAIYTDSRIKAKI